MVLVNTTVITVEGQLKSVIDKVKSTYYKSAVDAGFSHLLLTRVMSHQEPGQASLAVQFQAPSAAIADAWMDVEGQAALSSLTASFPKETVLYFTTTMGILARD